MIIFALALFSVLLTIITHVVWLLLWLGCLPWHYHMAYKPFGYATLVLIAVCCLLLLYGYWFGRFRHATKELHFAHPSVPASFDGYRIVHISDLHLDSWRGHASQLQKRVEEINALQPDLICFTGDLVSISSREVLPFIDILRSLKAKDGVVSVLGNHDYLPYARQLSPAEKEVQRAEIIRLEKEEIGWQLLLNEHVFVHRGSDSIVLIGCENQSMGAHPIVQCGDLTKAMPAELLRGEEQAPFSILLTHDPTQWRGEVLARTSIPLTLSGHTHAMQFRIFGWTPSRWIYPECDGLYRENGQSLYVNIGLGGTAPFRIGATPEITVITLKHE